MWPWEHILFAYIWYSLYRRGRYGTAPTDWPVLALVIGSLFPDLIDKPLAWQWAVFPTGYAVAHSVFVATPVSVSAYLIARYRGYGAIGGAFAIGYLLHLVGDFVPRSIGRGELYLDPILWPLATAGATGHEGFVPGLRANLIEYYQTLHGLDLDGMLAIQLGSMVIGMGLWIADGLPGLRALIVWGRSRPLPWDSRTRK